MQFLSALRNTPIPMILIAIGIFLLVFSIGPIIRGKIKVPDKRQRASVSVALILLFLGFSLYLLPILADALNLTNPPTILGVTIRKGGEGGELVYSQEINFFDEDGNTNLVERNLIDISDPSQRQFIQLQNSVVDIAPELQKIRATAIETWHCEGQVYIATVEVILVDRNGNKSEPVRYTIDCN